MNNFLISIILSTLLASFALYKNSLTTNGLITAWLLSIIITFCGGISSYIILCATFLLTIISSKISHTKDKKTFNDINQKTGKRDCFQILANVGIGTISLLIYHFSNNEIFLIAYVCVMASSTADSMASEIGVLSKQQPINICTFKKVPKGISGGITLLGLLSSLIGALIIAVIYIFTTKINISTLIIIILYFFKILL